MEGRQPAANSGAGSALRSNPEDGACAMLTSLEHYDVKEFPIPEVGDDDILVKWKAAVSAEPTHTNSRRIPSD